MLIDTVITRIIEMINEVLIINTSNDVHDQIYKYLNEDSNQFDTVRRSDTTQALLSVMDQPHKPDNAIRRLTGIDTLHILAGNSNTPNIS